MNDGGWIGIVLFQGDCVCGHQYNLVLPTVTRFFFDFVMFATAVLRKSLEILPWFGLPMDP